MTSPIARPSGDLYEAHQKVYPRDIQGRFARLRTIAAFSLLGLYYLIPWIDVHGRQAVLFDIRERKFYIFELVLWPQDLIFLTLLLVIAALSLFFFTALAGRLWCGYACPQTVWTEVFLWIERRVEGDRTARMRLDKAAWSWAKVGRKSLKQLLWIGLAAWTGFTFVGFFTPIRTLGLEFWTLSAGAWEIFWCLFYGAATYANAGLLREQVCKYMCPYARIQGAMFDRDTLVITYDAGRGDPRGARGRSAGRASNGLGDCIDCTWCVQVCPTGIDIRQGLQNECIACGACIDACDSVMDRVGYPRGLIRYTTERALAEKTTVTLRPRIVIYGALLLLVVVGFAIGLARRTPIGLDVIRDRSAMYRLLDDGRVENVYTLKILNKTEQSHRYTVTVTGRTPLSLDPSNQYTVAGGDVVAVVVRLRRAAQAPGGPETVRFRITATDDRRLTTEQPARYLAPGP